MCDVEEWNGDTPSCKLADDVRNNTEDSRCPYPPNKHNKGGENETKKGSG